MVETIVAAVIGGLAAASGKVASKTAEEAYGALKGLILRKLGAGSEAAAAIARLEAKPDSEGRKATVAEELDAARAGEDADLVEAARTLQAALDALPAEGRAHVQQAVGRYIAQADRGGIAKVDVRH